MKTSEQILSIINVKIKEHQDISKQMALDMAKLQQKLAEIAEHSPSNKEALFTQTTLVMTMKDRMMFHKACILQLQDIAKEINE